jgi:hypothetical protein
MRYRSVRLPRKQDQQVKLLQRQPDRLPAESNHQRLHFDPKVTKSDFTAGERVPGVKACTSEGIRRAGALIHPSDWSLYRAVFLVNGVLRTPGLAQVSGLALSKQPLGADWIMLGDPETTQPFHAFVALQKRDN